MEGGGGFAKYVSGSGVGVGWSRVGCPSPLRGVNREIRGGKCERIFFLPSMVLWESGDVVWNSPCRFNHMGIFFKNNWGN